MSPQIRLLTLAAVLSACVAENSQGALSATKIGGVITPPARRGPPDGPMQALCGDGGLTAAGVESLRRQPYLQQVTPWSAAILWAGAPGEAQRVAVTTPAGEAVTAVPAGPGVAVEGGGELRSAALGGLAPDTLYCYQLFGPRGALSRRAGLRTAPLPGRGAPVRFIAFGDSGTGGLDQRAVRDQLATIPFDLMLHTGDLAYESGTQPEIERGFFAVYAPLLRSLPIFPASGNHDYKTADARPFRDSFALPESGCPTGCERWYSFDWGDVHLVALDTERTGAEQAAWLDADLSRNRLPWTVVYLHRPPFSSGAHGSDGAVREHLVPLFERHRVPLVLAGHEHDYERSRPQRGVTYVVTGGGGVGTRPVGVSDFTAFSEPVLHFVHVAIEGDLLTLRAIDGAGQEFDGVQISIAR